MASSTSKKRKLLLIISTAAILGLLMFRFYAAKNFNLNPRYSIGQPLDSLHHVVVYYNGGVNHVSSRNMAGEYNVGLQYQCVEFVKRYYLEALNHKMPDSYGHAKSFFDPNVKDGAMNPQRNLTQYANPSKVPPEVGDLMVMSGTLLNRFGHVAIISAVSETEVEIIQQNPGPFTPSREKLGLKKIGNGQWEIEEKRVLGWLRK